MAGVDRKIAVDAVVGTLAFTADSKHVVGNCRDGKLRVWDPWSGVQKRVLDFEKGDSAITLPASPDQVAMVASNGNIKVRSVDDGKVIREFAGPKKRAGRLLLSKDRHLVAANVTTGNDDVVRVWDEAGKERFAVPAGIGGTSALAFSPDGNYVVAASYDTNVRAWSARNGELQRLIEELTVSMFAMTFSPDGKTLAAAGADNIIYLFDAKTWKVQRKIEGQPEMISAMAFSDDGKLLLTGGFNVLTQQRPVSLILWDVATGKKLRSMAAPNRVGTVAISPDNQLAASAGLDKTINIWAMPAR